MSPGAEWSAGVWLPWGLRVRPSLLCTGQQSLPGVQVAPGTVLRGEGLAFRPGLDGELGQEGPGLPTRTGSLGLEAA